VGSELVLFLVYLLVSAPFFLAIMLSVYGLRRATPRPVMDRIDAWFGHRALVWIWCMTTGLTLAILAVYFVERAFGTVPAPSEWNANHGPWRSTWTGTVAWTTLLVLCLAVPTSVLVTLGVAAGRGRWEHILRGIGLAIVCAIYLVLCAHFLFWTVD